MFWWRFVFDELAWFVMPLAWSPWLPLVKGFQAWKGVAQAAPATILKMLIPALNAADLERGMAWLVLDVPVSRAELEGILQKLVTL